MAYVTNDGSDDVAVIDLTTDSVTTIVSVGQAPEGIAVTPDGAHVYVANQGTDNVSVIEVATNTLIATVPVRRAPQQIAITSDGAFAIGPMGSRRALRSSRSRPTPWWPPWTWERARRGLRSTRADDPTA